MLQVRESQIEDVLCHHLDITRQLIKTSGDLTLIRRQKILPSGNRLDMLFMDKEQLNLIELKIESFKKIFLPQVISYRAELKKMQDNKELIKSLLSCIFFSSARYEITCGKKIFLKDSIFSSIKFNCSLSIKSMSSLLPDGNIFWRRINVRSPEVFISCLVISK